MFTIGLIIFLISFLVEAIENTVCESKNEIEQYKSSYPVIKRKHKVTRRRIIKDKEGNTMAEEVIEETEE